MNATVHSPARSTDDDTRRLAGNCYLALRTEDARYLEQVPTDVALSQSGLAGMHANLCARLGVTTTRERALHGLHLIAVNRRRWEALTEVTKMLAADGIAPVLFKGGALYARWPAMLNYRESFDYDLIAPQRVVGALRDWLALHQFKTVSVGSSLTQRLDKGWMVWKGNGLDYQNLDIHARVTEPPVCSSLTESILAAQEIASSFRVPDIEDSVCMISLHIVRSGMYRPLREYIDLLWYVEEMDELAWQRVVDRAMQHQLVPALFLSLRQAHHCLAMSELAPERAERLESRLGHLQRRLGRLRLRMLDWLAPADYPLHPIEARNRPVFRRSFILGAGTSSLWRVAVSFTVFGAVRLIDNILGFDSPLPETTDQ